jgi:glycosyltransferase involved in cell wall biosynthesis
MHILVLPSWYSTPETPWHGTFFQNQAVGLARAGARVAVAFVEPRSLRALSASNLRASHFQITSSEDQGVRFLRLKGWNTVLQTVTGAKLWAALSESLVGAYVRRFGVPDVIHAHAALWAGRVAVRMGRKLSRPTVVTEHSSAMLCGTLSSRRRREAEQVYRGADAVLAVSRVLSDAVDSIAGRELCRVVPNAVDLEFFTLPLVRRRREPFTFLCVCNLVGGKRVDRLIRAFAAVSLDPSSIRLVIVGEGPEAGNLQRLASQCGIADRVEFAGGLPAQGVRDRMWTANALVVPSDFETFGVVLIEALATGIPVIATRCGGPEEIIEPEIGLLVDRDDGQGLATAMAAVATRSWSESTLRSRVAARFGVETVAEELLDVYRALLAASGKLGSIER